MSRNVDIAISQVENSAKCPMGPLWGPKLANCQKSPTAKTRQLPKVAAITRQLPKLAKGLEHLCAENPPTAQTGQVHGHF